MRLLLLSIFSVLLGLKGFGQTDSLAVSEGQQDFEKVEQINQADTAATEEVTEADAMIEEVAAADTVPKEKPRFIQPIFTFDYGKAITTVIGLDKKYEAGLSLLFFNHYNLIAEYGTGVLEPENAFRNGIYKSEGSYFRFGGGYLNQINLTSKLGLGILYGVSDFSDSGQVFIESSSGVQEDYTKSFDRPNLEARWLEVVITSESWVRLNKQNPQAKINKLFALGFHARFRFLTSYDNFDLFDVYSIPGYGRSVNDPQVALNLFLKVYPF